MSKTLRHLELFAGIGGFRKAIELYCADHSFQAHCVGFSEIDKYARLTYQSNFNTNDEVEIGDIESFCQDIENIERLPDFDLLSGGFPCQAFSIMGEKKGFEDKRGNLFYNIIDIIQVKRPKYVLLENVRGIKNHDRGRTYKEIIRSLEEDAGYFVSSDIFNTADFGLPQNRRRAFFFAIRKDLISSSDSINFSAQRTLDLYKSLKSNNSLLHYKNVLDGILEKSVEQKFYLSERIKPTILSNGSKNFKSKSEINQLIARPLTATMVKMHRACQDNYYSDEFLNHLDPVRYLNIKYSKEEQAKHSIRKLTPSEALKLQGFDTTFYNNAKNAGVSNHQLYKQAGNAVSVNTVYYILKLLFNDELIKI